MSVIKNLQTFEFVTCISDSDGQPVEGTQRGHTLLFNSSQISRDEVLQLVDTGRWEYDDRVVQVTRSQLQFLKDKEN